MSRQLAAPAAKLSAHVIIRLAARESKVCGAKRPHFDNLDVANLSQQVAVISGGDTSGIVPIAKKRARFIVSSMAKKGIDIILLIHPRNDESLPLFAESEHPRWDRMQTRGSISYNFFEDFHRIIATARRSKHHIHRPRELVSWLLEEQ